MGHANNLTWPTSKSNPFIRILVEQPVLQPACWSLSDGFWVTAGQSKLIRLIYPLPACLDDYCVSFRRHHFSLFIANCRVRHSSHIIIVVALDYCSAWWVPMACQRRCLCCRRWRTLKVKIFFLALAFVCIHRRTVSEYYAHFNKVYAPRQLNICEYLFTL